jgi:hypothetical protein
VFDSASHEEFLDGHTLVLVRGKVLPVPFHRGFVTMVWWSLLNSDHSLELVIVELEVTILVTPEE